MSTGNTGQLRGTCRRASILLVSAALLLTGCAPQQQAPADDRNPTMTQAVNALHRELDAQLGEGASAYDQEEYFALADGIMRRALDSCDQGQLQLVGVAVEDEPLRAATAVLCPAVTR